MEWFRVVHIVAMIAWMAGLFYLPRLFVYHCQYLLQEHQQKSVKTMFTTMERRLYRIIMWPAMLLTWGFGLALIMFVGWIPLWLWLKLICVIALTGFHMFLGFCIRCLANEQNRLTPRQYRWLNEIPTVLLVCIVILVVVQPF